MADSDISMNYARVTRRASLLGAAAIAVGATGSTYADARSGAIGGSFYDAGAPSPDPAVALWREWQATHHRVQALSQRLQDLEVALAERFDTFGAIVPLPEGGTARVYSLSDLDSLFGDRADMGEVRLHAERAFAARQADFESVSAELDYFPTMESEQEAFTKARALLDRMMDVPATSFTGVAAKLDAVSRWGEAWAEQAQAFPWPHIRSVQTDLLVLGSR